MQIKRGTKIEFTYFGGKTVTGKVLGPAGIEGWARVTLTDESGSYAGGLPCSDLRIVDNRPNRTIAA